MVGESESEVSGSTPGGVDVCVIRMFPGLGFLIFTSLSKYVYPLYIQAVLSLGLAQLVDVQWFSKSK